MNKRRVRGEEGVRVRVRTFNKNDERRLALGLDRVKNYVSSAMAYHLLFPTWGKWR
jgi:hypothetical protein